MRIRDYVLLSSAIAGDFLTEVKNVGDIMPGVMKMCYGFVPPNYKKTSYTSAVSRLLKVGDIERKAGEDEKQYIELSARGKSSFKRRFPILVNTKSKWDGNFMVVIFDIPEKERLNRDLLRQRLQELGFGMLQESVWISPYHFEEDLREFLESKDLGNCVFVLTAKKLLGGNTQELVEKTWHLDEVKNGYRRILRQIGDQKPAKKVWDDYLSVLKTDPMIPENIYTMKGLREKVMASISKLQK